MTVARVLILDGQTNQGLACARSLGAAGYEVLVASHVRWPLAAWSRHCSEQFHLRSETVAEFGRLRQRLSRPVDYLLPLTERACVLANLEREQWEAQGTRLACASQDILARAFDKGETAALATRCKVSVPETRVPDSLASAKEAARAIGFPCVIKQRFSNALDGDRFLPTQSCAYVSHSQELESQLHVRRQGEHWPLIQAYVRGEGKGVFALCNRGQVVAWFAHQRLRDVRPTGSGSSLRRATALDPRLREPAAALLAEMQWHGPAMVEFRDDGIHPPWLMEVNGRFWGSLELAIQAGVDFPRLWLDILADQPVSEQQDYRTDVTLRWLWGDMKRLMYVMAGRPMGYKDSFPSRAQGLREIFGRQPTGTRPEIWRRDDPWPAVAEWVQGFREVLARHH